MRKILLAVAMLSSFAAVATPQGPSEEQIKRASEIPGTVVVARNRKTGEIRVAHVKNHIPREKFTNEAVKGLTFEKMARNSQQVGIAYTAADEDDRATSTNSWRFGFAGVGPRGGVWAGGAVGWGGGGWGGGWGNGCGSWGCGGGCGSWGGCGGFQQTSFWGGGGYGAVCQFQQCGGWAWPNYAYQNMNYGYYPYAQASMGGWDVYGCNWGW